MTKHITLLGAEGKTVARDFMVRLLASGVKVSIAGDLWSDGGMGLFGIYAHDITETWVPEKVLIGLVACEKEVRQTLTTFPHHMRANPKPLPVAAPHR